MYCFTGRVCPRCDTEVKNYGKLIETTDDDLVLVKGKEKKKKATREEKQQFYSMAKWYADKKGYQHGWVAWTYKFRFKVWPRGMKDFQTSPDEKFMSYIHHMNIVKAKSREKKRKIPFFP